MPITRVALVGHCGFDSGSLSQLAKVIAPSAQVLRINEQQAMDEVADEQSLLLINRMLDGRFDVGGSGVELIRTLSAKDKPPAMMLVSNYEDAQQQAQQAGALPGFGKSQVADTQTVQRLIETVASL